jgi:hypothetical protein
MKDEFTREKVGYRRGKKHSHDFAYGENQYRDLVQLFYLRPGLDVVPPELPPDTTPFE